MDKGLPSYEFFKNQLKYCLKLKKNPNSGLDIAGLHDVDEVLAVLPVPSDTAPEPGCMVW